jgi:hypothetical protein
VADILLTEEHAFHILRHSEAYGHGLTPQIRRQLIEKLESDLQLPIVRLGSKLGVQLDR